MVHKLIASPYPDGYVVVSPGRTGGIKIGTNKYAELRDAPGAPVPAWLSDHARTAWGLDVTGAPVSGTVMVRPETAYGYARASYELNLGCNYDFFWIKKHHPKWHRPGHHGPTHSSAAASPSACARRTALGSVNRTGFPCWTA
jgi:hypothetical protein